jgi:hypothetical protein
VFRVRAHELIQCRLICPGPYSTLPEYAAVHSLTAGTLRGPSKLAVPPMVFAKDDESEAIVIVHLGRSLCGHDGIVHGGMVGTILDEATGRNALLNLPTKIGVTGQSGSIPALYSRPWPEGSYASRNRAAADFSPSVRIFSIV